MDGRGVDDDGRLEAERLEVWDRYLRRSVLQPTMEDQCRYEMAAWTALYGWDGGDGLDAT